MKDLGAALLVLGGLQLAVVILVRVAAPENITWRSWIAPALALTLCLLAFRGLGWVNYVVTGLACAMIAYTCWMMATTSDSDISVTGAIFAFVIYGVLLAAALNNRRLLGQLRAAERTKRS